MTPMEQAIADNRQAAQEARETHDKSLAAERVRDRLKDALAALESKQADDLAATLGQKAPAGEDSAVSLARTRISRLASLVSGEPGQALKALAAQATRFSSAQMIALAAERWKTQDDWIER